MRWDGDLFVRTREIYVKKSKQFEGCRSDNKDLRFTGNLIIFSLQIHYQTALSDNLTLPQQNNAKLCLTPVILLFLMN